MGDGGLAHDGLVDVISNLDVREQMRTASGARGRNRTTDTAIFSRLLYP